MRGRGVCRKWARRRKEPPGKLRPHHADGCWMRLRDRREFLPEQASRGDVPHWAFRGVEESEEPLATEPIGKLPRDEVKADAARAVAGERQTPKSGRPRRHLPTAGPQIGKPPAGNFCSKFISREQAAKPLPVKGSRRSLLCSHRMSWRPSHLLPRALGPHMGPQELGAGYG